MSRTENNFFKGIRDGLPICLGYLSVSFAFGIFAVESGLTIWQVLLISMMNVTSAGQLAGVPIMCGGFPLAEMALTQLVINMRYALMSVSLSQKLGKNVRLFDRFVIAFMNTDEIFAVASSQFGLVGRKYLYGLILTPYLGWSGGTLLGAVAGNILPEIVTSALGIAIYGMFVAIVVPPAKKSRAVLGVAIVSAALSCCLKYIPIFSGISAGIAIIICAVVASAIFAVIKPIPDEKKEAE